MSVDLYCHSCYDKKGLGYLNEEYRGGGWGTDTGGKGGGGGAGGVDRRSIIRSTLGGYGRGHEATFYMRYRLGAWSRFNICLNRL